MKNQFTTICFYTLVSIVFINGAQADLYKRAPDVLPGTIPEMRTASYWIEQMKKPDEVILNVNEIQLMNEAYQKRVQSPEPFKNEPEDRKPNLNTRWPGRVLQTPDLDSMKPEVVADTVRARINIQIEYLRSKNFGNCLAVEYSDWEIDAFEKEMACDLVKDKVTVKYGISVHTTRLRSIPSFFPQDIGLTDSGKTRWDMFNIGILKIASSVTVLHPSRSGEYLLVFCEEGYGWVMSEDIAFGTKQSIDTFTNSRDFVVCTGDRVPYYSDENCTYASGWFMMGDRLPVFSKKSHRIVKVPVRKVNSEFTTDTAWLPQDADVHIGWLPYTRRNIIETAIKLLDTPYDWTGAWFGRQHENTYRDIFTVFGFKLPLYGGLFTFFGDDETLLIPDAGKEEQYKTIMKHEPFVTLQSCGGHAQLLLGEHNGVPIVFDQHGYGYEDENGTYLEIRRCCIGTVELPSYFLKNNITFLKLK